MSEYIKKLRVIDADGNPQDKQIDYEALANKPELVGQKYDVNNGEIFNDYENNIASMPYTHVEGYKNEASGAYAHVEGSNNKATHNSTHVEGANNTASAPYAHVEGWTNTASGLCAHAGGKDSTAAGTGSFAHGLGVNAQGEAATVFGKYNDNEGDYIFTVGNGSSTSARSNALTLDNSGNLNIQSNIYTNIGSIQDEDLLDYHRVLNYNDLLNILTSLIHIGDSAPSDWDRDNYGNGTRAYPLLWIDTSSETGGLKYLDNNEQWRHVPVAYTE